MGSHPHVSSRGLGTLVYIPRPFVQRENRREALYVYMRMGATRVVEGRPDVHAIYTSAIHAISLLHGHQAYICDGYTRMLGPVIPPHTIFEYVDAKHPGNMHGGASSERSLCVQACTVYQFTEVG